ncbi:MAG TPA: hypothetical protein PKD85_09415, partial [Saprospiraceae bacterium]|nr:hypothetical protein [Saprospiraceae bacterium]
MRFVFYTLILSLTLAPLYGQDNKFIHLSLIHGLSTQGIDSKITDYNLSLNIMTGRVHNLRGFNISSLMSQIDGDMTGVQISGLINNTKGTVRGFQTSGISNKSGIVIGYQNAGIYNHSKNVVGLQTSGLINYAEEVTGVQAAGLINKTTILRGFQFGLINIADSVTVGSGGIGLINLYKKGGFKSYEISSADYQN